MPTIMRRIGKREQLNVEFNVLLNGQLNVQLNVELNVPHSGATVVDRITES